MWGWRQGVGWVKKSKDNFGLKLSKLCVMCKIVWHIHTILRLSTVTLGWLKSDMEFCTSVGTLLAEVLVRLWKDSCTVIIENW